MIDYGFQFTNAAQAIADATMLVGQYNSASALWSPDHVIAGITCWRPSKDVTTQQTIDGQLVNVVTHTFLVGYFVLVSIEAPPIPVLLNHSKLAFALDRTAREAGQPFVVKNNIGAILADLACQPMFAMVNSYPMGGFQ